MLDDGGYYNTSQPYSLAVNGACLTTDRVVNFISGLTPSTAYTLEAGGVTAEFVTDDEFVTLNVREMGAYGDGEHDDTVYIQAAIMACPEKGRVYIPAGEYKITALFLKSNLRLELSEGAVLSCDTERYCHPVLPGMVGSYDEKSEYNLGTWEGNPLPMFAGGINGIDVENVDIYGKGRIFGGASHENWWHDEKTKRGAWRPRLLFLLRCRNIDVFGLNFSDSPSWTIHPYYSQRIKLMALGIKNPMVSPNTDGIDVECCDDVQIRGVHFSLGDDCVAVKSGKIYMAKKYKVPCKNITIENCHMECGHGAVTVGSEMAGGVYGLVVRRCFFKDTDRGLRIKTRRGRGELAVVDDVLFDKIIMDHVKTPFVANCFYFCDPDGRSDYVQNRTPREKDESTPHIKKLEFTDIKCYNTHIAAAYFIGLPEQKISRVVMESISIDFAENAEAGEPAMLCGIEPMKKQGIIATNVEELICRNVTINGIESPRFTLENVDRLEE